MNEKKAKKIRQKLLTNTSEMLLIIRNHYGELTDKMDARKIYKATKKLYKKGLIKI